MYSAACGQIKGIKFYFYQQMSENKPVIQLPVKEMKAIAQLVPALLFLLLAGAVLFYKERMLFIDSPHVLFRVVNDGRLHIEEHRIGSFITQMFPLLFSKLGIPFRMLVVLYSASFYIFYGTVALLLVYKFKNYGLAILFGLYFTLFVSDTYYWPNNEVHQGITWLFLAFALNAYFVERSKPLLIGIMIFAATFALAIWTHPLVMIVAVYLWVAARLRKEEWPYSMVQTIVFSLLLLTISYLKFRQGNEHGYDATKIELVTKIQLPGIGEILQSPVIKYFFEGCLNNYWLFIAIFAAGLFYAIRQGKYLFSAFTVLCAMGYLLLLGIVFKDVNTNRFYIESEYMPLAIICSAPFVYYLLPKLNIRTGTLLITVIFCVRLLFIFQAHHKFSNRVAILDGMLNKMKEKNLTKIAIPEPVPFADSALIMNWGAPVESIILSKLKGDDPQRTFLFADPNLLTTALKTRNDTLIGCWEIWPKARINSTYFRPDWSAPYTTIGYTELMK